MMGPTRTHASLQDISFIGFPSYRSAILFIIPYNEISLDFFIDSNILDNFISLLLAETRPRTRAPHALYVSTNFIHTTPYSLPCFLRLMSFCSDALSWSRNGARCVFRISFGAKRAPKVRLWSITIKIYHATGGGTTWLGVALSWWGVAPLVVESHEYFTPNIYIWVDSVKIHPTPFQTKRI